IRDFHVTGVQTCALPIWAIGVLRRRQAWQAGTASRHRLFRGLVGEQAEGDRGEIRRVSAVQQDRVQAARLPPGRGPLGRLLYFRSEERRVGKEGRAWRSR